MLTRSRLVCSPPVESRDATSDWFFPRETFLRLLVFERKRTERSGRPFVLMLLESGNLLKDGADPGVLDKLLTALRRSTRETDIKGWYDAGSTMGVIFADIGPEPTVGARALFPRISDAFGSTLSIEQIKEIRLSLHRFPESPDTERSETQPDNILYPDVSGERSPGSRILKRAMDIAGSIAALVLFSPLMAAIAILIKLTSRGPVLFRQQRVGMDGRTFTFLKFRSMHVSSDHSIHEEYVTSLIAGDNGSPPGEPVYKMTRDPRVTPVGRFLRRTSLDELPQFVNVLKGEMSLVGPRPAIPYEVKRYALWHHRRFLGIKPGVTGLWQVEGRSRVTFDEMVRLDLRYARSWSPLLDLKLLLRTPKAVVSGSGAY